MSSTKNTTKDKVMDLTAQLNEGIENLFNREDFQAYLRKMAVFHNYSIRNSILIFLQNPEATRCAGYKAWNKLNRQVKKGEKAIKIFCPCKYKMTLEEYEEKKWKVPSYAEVNKNGEFVEYVVFRVGNVFDISQTDGEDIGYERTFGDSGSCDDFERILEILKNVSPVPIKFEEIKREGVNGYFSRTTKDIAISSSLSQIEQLKVIVHEMAHSILHADREVAKKKSRLMRETEAEGVAFVVSSYLGFDSSDSFSYISEWSKDIELFKNCLRTIQSTAHSIISDIEKLVNKDVKE